MSFLGGDSDVNATSTEQGTQAGKSSANFVVGNSDDGARVTLSTTEDNSIHQVDNSDNSIYQNDTSDNSIRQFDNSVRDDSVTQIDSSINIVDQSIQQFDSSVRNDSVTQIDSSVRNDSVTQIDRSDRSIVNSDNRVTHDNRNLSTNQYDNSINDNRVANTVTDLGAINSSFDFAKNALGNVANNLVNVLSFASGNNQSAFNLVESNTASSLDFVANAFTESVDSIQASSASESERSLDTVIGLSEKMFMLIGLIAVVGIGAVAMRKA